MNSHKVLDAKKQPELRRKSRAILVDAFSHLGPGLCMLCMSTVPYTMLAGFKLDMRKLEEWWRGRTVPECLFCLVEEFSICETIERMRILDALSVTSSLRNLRPNEHAPPVTEEMESHRFGWTQRHEDVDLSSSSKASGTEQIHASDDAIRSSWR